MNMQTQRLHKDESDDTHVSFEYRLPKLASTTLYTQPGVVTDGADKFKRFSLSVLEITPSANGPDQVDTIARADYDGLMQPLILPRGMLAGVVSPNGSNFTSRALGVDFRDGRAFSADRGRALTTVPDASNPALDDPRVIDLTPGHEYALAIVVRNDAADHEGYEIETFFTLDSLRRAAQSSLVTLYVLLVRRVSKGTTEPLDLNSSLGAVFIRGTLIGTKLSLTRVLMLWQGTGYSMTRLKNDVLETPTPAAAGAENLSRLKDAYKSQKGTWRSGITGIRDTLLPKQEKRITDVKAREEAQKPTADQGLVNALTEYDNARKAAQDAIAKAEGYLQDVKAVAKDQGRTFLGKAEYAELREKIKWLDDDELDPQDVTDKADAVVQKAPKVTAGALWPDGIGPDVMGDKANWFVKQFAGDTPWYIQTLNGLALKDPLEYDDVIGTLAALRKTPDGETGIYNEKEFVRPPVFLKREVNVRKDGGGTETRTIVYAITSWRNYRHPLVKYKGDEDDNEVRRLKAWVWDEGTGIDYPATIGQLLDVKRQTITSLDTPSLKAAGYKFYPMNKVEYGSAMYRLWKTTNGVRAKARAAPPAGPGVKTPQGVGGKLRDLFFSKATDAAGPNDIEKLLRAEGGDAMVSDSSTGDGSSAPTAGAVRRAPRELKEKMRDWVKTVFVKVPVLDTLFENDQVPVGVPKNVYFRKTDKPNEYEAYTAGFYQNAAGETRYAEPAEQGTYTLGTEVDLDITNADADELIALASARNNDPGVLPYFFDADISDVGGTNYLSFVKVLRPLGEEEEGVVGGTAFYLDQVIQVNKANEARAANNEDTVSVYLSSDRGPSAARPSQPDILGKISSTGGWLFKKKEVLETINSNRPFELTYDSDDFGKEDAPLFLHAQDVEVLRASLAAMKPEAAEEYGDMLGFLRPVVRKRFATTLIPKASVVPALQGVKGVTTAKEGKKYLVTVDSHIGAPVGRNPKPKALWTASTLIVERMGANWKVLRPDYRLLTRDQIEGRAGISWDNLTITYLEIDEKDGYNGKRVYGYASPTPAEVDALVAKMGAIDEGKLKNALLFRGWNDAAKDVTYKTMARDLTWPGPNDELTTRAKQQLAFLILSGAPGLAVDGNAFSGAAASPLSLLAQLEAGIVPASLLH